MIDGVAITAALATLAVSAAARAFGRAVAWEVLRSGYREGGGASGRATRAARHALSKVPGGGRADARQQLTNL